MSRFDEKPEAPRSPLNSFFSSDRKVGKGLATYGGLDHQVLDQHATIEDVDGDANAVTEAASDEDTLFAVGRSHWGVDNPNLADEVATSAAVMDRVSVSDTALDAIWQSQTAWDIVKAKSMAVGKFAAGRAGLNGADYADVDAVASSQTAMDAVSTSSTAMDAVSTSSTAMDAVSTSQTAMDAVSTSQTAMDAVAASIDARSAVFESDYALGSLWASTPGAKTILQNSGNKSLPFHTSTPGGDANITVDDGSSSGLPGSTAHQLYFDINGADDGNYVSITYSLDLSGSDTLELKEKAEGNRGPERMKLGVKIDGTQVFQIAGYHGYTTRSLDISTYNGTHDVEFYHDNTGYNNTGTNAQFYIADIDLI